MIESAVNSMLNAYQPVFSELTKLQKNFLRVLYDGLINGFSEQKTLQKYRLTNSATVAHVKKSLTAKNPVIFEGTSHPAIADPVFKFWLKKSFRNLL